MAAPVCGGPGGPGENGDMGNPVEVNVAAAGERPALGTYEELASMAEWEMVRPELTDEDILAGCAGAREYRVGTVLVRSSDVDLAARALAGSGVAVGAAIGFPHGSAQTAAKLYEGRDALRRGARELSLVVNIGKLLSRQFQYVETEIMQMAASCRESGAKLKVVYETGYLSDELKIILTKILKRTEVHFVEPGTGFGPSVALAADLAVIQPIGRDRVQYKASGVASLDEAQAAYAAGCDRFGTMAAASILDDWKAVLAEREAAAKAQASE
jgi:deoxyribose-phosphate aldolase